MYKVFSFDDIKGMDSLWEIVLLCQDSKVKEECLYLLCCLHINLHPQRFEQEDREKIWAIFVDKCLENLKTDNKAITNSAILALNKLFDTFEGKNMDLEDVSSGTTFPIRVYCADDSTYKSIQIPYLENLLFARRKIAQAFDFGLNEFSVYVNGKPLGAEQNETAIKEIGFNEVFLVKKAVQDSQGSHPKNLLVGNQEFFNLMFELLSNDEDYDVDNTKPWNPRWSCDNRN